MIKSLGISLLLFTAVATATPTFTPKIVGGENAVQGEFPYIVSLRSKSYGHFCGASLVAQNWVLTAAHCVKGGKIDEVWVGMLDQKNTAGVEKFKTVKIIAHEKYHSGTLDFDYALIQIDQNSSFKPVALNETEIVINGETIMSITAGWGATKESSNTLPNILQKVSVPLVSANDCNSKESYNGDVTENMICAGYKKGGKDSCQGDSGGPLVVTDSNGSHVLAGVVSWGEGCARANKYGVYSKVSAAIPWIKANMQ